MIDISKSLIAASVTLALMGVSSTAVNANEYVPKYKADVEQWNQVAVSAFVLGPYMKIVGEYQKSLEKYPNPPAFSMTKFAK